MLIIKHDGQQMINIIPIFPRKKNNISSQSSPKETLETNRMKCQLLFFWAKLKIYVQFNLLILN